MSLVLPPTVQGLMCIACGFATTDPWQWSCPRCGPDARMDVVYAPGAAEAVGRNAAARPRNLWRYAELLPVREGAPHPPLPVGWTPVIEAPRLAEWLGVRRVLIKDDSRNPSASAKDRASAVGVALARLAGRDRIACASTGNAAASTACLAASVGLGCTIFVPARAPLPKIAQLLAFGAQVLRVDADYDRTWDLCSEVVATRPWFNRNCAVNPYLVEGKKTCGLELAEQLGTDLPDWVAVGVGDGCTVAGLVKGLEEGVAAGFASRVPRVLGVQAEGAAPLVRAFHEGGPAVMSDAHTVADSIDVGHPRNPDKALFAVRRSGGEMIAVPDAAILEAIVAVAERTGIFGEPAGVACAAGVARAVREGLIGPDESVGIVVTGHGLKDPMPVIDVVAGTGARSGGGEVIDVAADVDAVNRALG